MKLSHLTNSVLHKDLNFLVQQERNLLSKVLWHLREVDKRKLYCEYKCGSLFEYAVKVLKYSEGQASRRVSACRLLADLPELSAKIESGGLNITLLDQAKRFFSDEKITKPSEKIKVIDQITGKTTRESERILDDLKKEKPVPKVTITINKTTHEALEDVRALKAHQYKDMDSLLLGISLEVLSHWNPIKTSRKMKKSEGDSRYVQVQVKSDVWARDQGQCQNCGSKYALQIDHITPFSRGGKTVEKNLRLLCRNCNQKAAMDSFGRDWKRS
jgi:hypothetical protein